MLTVVEEGSETNETGGSLLDGIVRDGARSARLPACRTVSLRRAGSTHCNEVSSETKPSCHGVRRGQRVIPAGRLVALGRRR